MKRFLGFAMVLFAVLGLSSCSQEVGLRGEYLDVTPNNISGVWRVESFDNGVELNEDTYRYIVFNRKDKSFVSYDNLGSMEVYRRSGRFDITTDKAAIIRGMYDYGAGDWEHSYYVRDLTKERMVWVATDDESLVTVYVRAELPEWIPVEEEK